MSRAAGLGLALALALFVFLADQGLKRHIEGSIRLGESTALIPDVLRLTHIENAGGAFGILDERGGLLLLGSVIAVAFILGMLLQRPPDRVTTMGCGLILGGAAGNLFDRLTEGVVTDYLDLEFWPLEAWPVFNAADAAIVFGVLVLLLAARRPEKASRRSAKS